MRKDAYLPQRSLKHAAPFITCVVYTVLKNICQVSGCIATSVPLQYILPCLSVSSACILHFVTFIIHTYLHHLCILAFFNNHLFRIYLSSKKKKKREKKRSSMGVSSLQ